MKKILFTILLILIPICVHAQKVSTGYLLAEPHETEGMAHWYVKPTASGTTSCRSWNDACVLTTALAKLSSDYQDVIHLAPGDHAVASAEAGSTISVNDVRIVAFTEDHGTRTQIVNSAGTVSNVLIVSGSGFAIENVRFNQADQTDDEATLLSLTGANTLIKNCIFRQDGDEASGTGVSITGGGSSHHFVNSTFRGNIDYGLYINSAHGINIEQACFCTNGKGFSSVGASDHSVNIKDSIFRYNTLGFEVTGASAENFIVKGSSMIHNTTNVDVDSMAYDEAHFINIEYVHQVTAVYPAAAGVEVDTGDGAWTWTAAATTIMAADTVTNPFIITGINVQAADASQIFKIELLYGESTASESIAVVELVIGASTPAFSAGIGAGGIIPKFIPANSIVGAKVMSSTAGVDSITITFSYQEL